MGIRFACHHCRHPMHVKDFLAGKRGKCPECKQQIRIPLADATYSLPPQQEGASTPSSTDNPSPISTPTVAKEERASSLPATETNTVTAPAPAQVQWLVRPPSGGQYGPAPEELLRTWIAENRVTADSYLWAEGQPNWRLASEVFPELYPGLNITPAPQATEIAPKVAETSNEPSDAVPVPSHSSPAKNQGATRSAASPVKSSQSKAVAKPTSTHPSTHKQNIATEFNPIDASFVPQQGSKGLDAEDIDFSQLEFDSASAASASPDPPVNASSIAEIKARRRQQQKAMQLKIIIALSALSLILLICLVFVLTKSPNKTESPETSSNTNTPLSPPASSATTTTTTSTATTSTATPPPENLLNASQDPQVNPNSFNPLNQSPSSDPSSELDLPQTQQTPSTELIQPTFPDFDPTGSLAPDLEVGLDTPPL